MIVLKNDGIETTLNIYRDRVNITTQDHRQQITPAPVDIEKNMVSKSSPAITLGQAE